MSNHSRPAHGKHSTNPVLRRLDSVHPQVAALIRSRHPELADHAMVAADVINSARLDYVRGLLQSQLGELTKLDEEVVESLHDHEVLSQRPPDESEEDAKLTFGQRLSDKLAEFGGSWTFIMAFGGFMGIWIVLNVVFLRNSGYDPYPFILLNLILSCLASLQAPVIMMSQNRQEIRDRRRAEGDYKINLKAELEIRHLHEKIDYMLHQQTTRLLEIQQIQLELMREMARGRGEGKGEE